MITRGHPTEVPSPRMGTLSTTTTASPSHCMCTDCRTIERGQQPQPRLVPTSHTTQCRTSHHTHLRLVAGRCNPVSAYLNVPGNIPKAPVGGGGRLPTQKKIIFPAIRYPLPKGLEAWLSTLNTTVGAHFRCHLPVAAETVSQGVSSGRASASVGQWQK